MPTLILRGGPFDGREVKSRSEADVIPDELGFTRTGACEFSSGDAGTGSAVMFVRWLMANREPPDDAPDFQLFPYRTHYRRTGQVDDLKRIVFTHAPSPNSPMGETEACEKG